MLEFISVMVNLHIRPVVRVRISSLSESYYKQRYVTARRTISQKSYTMMVGSYN